MPEWSQEAYQRAFNAAAEPLRPVEAALKERGVPASIEQTGGFCMVAYVYLTDRLVDGAHLGIAEDGGLNVCLYSNGEDEGTVLLREADESAVVALVSSIYGVRQQQAEPASEISKNLLHMRRLRGDLVKRGIEMDFETNQDAATEGVVGLSRSGRNGPHLRVSVFDDGWYTVVLHKTADDEGYVIPWQPLWRAVDLIARECRSAEAGQTGPIF